MFRHCIVILSSVLRHPVIWPLKMRSLCCLEMLDDSNPDMGRSITEEKDKAIPLQAWTGTEVSRSLRLVDFKTIGM